MQSHCILLNQFRNSIDLLPGISSLAEYSALFSEKFFSRDYYLATESEVVSLIHQKTPKPDIARAVMNALAGRIASLARIVGLEKDVVMVGGMAKNASFVNSLKKNIEMDVLVPEDPDYMGALGAAEAAITGVYT